MLEHKCQSGSESFLFTAIASSSSGGVVLRSVAQLCPTLRDPMDWGPPGSSVHGILQARILEWLAISYSRASSQDRDQAQVSCVSCIGRRILSHCATWEAPSSSIGPDTKHMVCKYLMKGRCPRQQIIEVLLNPSSPRLFSPGAELGILYIYMYIPLLPELLSVLP